MPSTFPPDWAAVITGELADSRVVTAATLGVATVRLPAESAVAALPPVPDAARDPARIGDVSSASGAALLPESGARRLLEGGSAADADSGA